MGGWGRLSVDGPGQNNPDRSEGPWGRAAESARTEVFTSASSLTQRRESRWQQRARRAMANQVLGRPRLKFPALKPYRGKPAVRNFRGGDGNVGIIRSPLRAIVLPDRRRARTDLCGGRSAMIVPTATATRSGSNFLYPLVNGKGRSVRKVAPNIGDSCEFTASPAAATRRAGRLESGDNAPNGPKSPFGLLGVPVI